MTPYITLIDIHMGQDLVVIKSYQAQVAPFLPRLLVTPQISPVFPPGFSPETKAVTIRKWFSMIKVYVPFHKKGR